MEHRRLRLGDILDDYCPRERRVTDHAVVAMVGENVKQTRCTACDAEHAYKGGKAPRPRKKESTEKLYEEVLAGMPEDDSARVLTPPPVTVDAIEADSQEEPVAAEAAPAVREAAPSSVEAETEPQQLVPAAEEGPVHRPLIRATLPRPEGQKDARPLPDFTVRQAGRGNGNFRGGDQRMKLRGPGQNGNRTHTGPRFAGPRPGSQGRGSVPGRGQGAGFRGAQHSRRGGKKRSR
jgi:hypothetical protein